MVRTNILVEVDEKVNNLVVIPHKRAKTFSKLMASLLQGYVEDEYIRAYADGTLDDMRKASVDVLDEVLDSMTQSLSSMGVYNAEMKRSNKRGLEHFQKYSQEKEEEIKSFSSETEAELRGAVDELKEQNAMILKLLENLSNGSVSIEKKEEPKPVEVIKPVEIKQPVAEEKVTPAPIHVEEELPQKEVSVTKEVEEDDDDYDVAGLMDSLMSGNQYQF